jgi:RNA polymerase sigma-70 factor (ECF subfamily)
LESTSQSLLYRAGGRVAEAWARLDRLYRPFIQSWFLIHGIQRADAEDLTQEVMMVVLRELKEFSHSNRAGAFRTWLRGVCLH